jgi:ankyrin repeat protein
MEFMRAVLEAGADPNVRLEKHLWFMQYNFDLLGVDTAGATPFWRAAYALDIPAMRLLLEFGADPTIPTRKQPERRRRGGVEEDPSGLPPIPVGGPGVYPIHAASGVGYGKDFAGNSHRAVPGGWIPAVRFLVEELGADVNERDHEGYSALHHAASRGDLELIQYLVDQGADVMAVSRRGQTTADMANGPVQRVEPYPEAIQLLESLGSENNNKCLSC